MTTKALSFKEALPLAKGFIDFVNKACSPWHAVDEIRKRLLQAGFQHLSEKQPWKLQLNGKYFVTRNQSTIVSFVIGGKYKAGNGFKIIGAHTDSPDLRLKPVSSHGKQDYLQVGVQCYGGGLWHTWFDRDLTVAGRVIVETEKNTFEHRLVRVDRPILRIPNLAIHLDRSVNEKGFVFNKETHLVPIISTAVSNQLGEKKEEKKDEKKDEKTHPILLDLLSSDLDCGVQKIRDFELSVVDTQPAVIGGANQEFIFSPRIDNLLSCFTALDAFVNSLDTVSNDTDVRVIAFFDNEEIGSQSAQGAGSALMKDVIIRVHKLMSDKDTEKDSFNTAVAKSFIISSDMAHAIHPNYTEKHEHKHAPKMHKGPVIKVNCNQRYATNASTAFLLKCCAEEVGVPLQEYVVRNDSGCGSTIGPILSSNCGIRTVDVGIPQLSMHSIREMCGTVDVTYSRDLFISFFNNFRKFDDALNIDG